jgi:hypothetical protein
MSVRPITITEEYKAKGQPFVNILAVFGGTQGLLMYLNRMKIPITENWFQPPGGVGRFSFFVVGGFIAGGLIGMAAFTDRPLLRLYYSHQRDIILTVDGQKASDYTQ